MSFKFNTTYITISNPTSSSAPVSDDLIGMTPFFFISILVSMVFILCIIIWTLLICHYRLKFQVAKLKQFNVMDNATIFQEITRQRSAPSAYIKKFKPKSLSLDVSHSYNFHKEKTQSLDDQTVSDHMHHLTVNHLYNSNINKNKTQTKTSDSLLNYMGLSKQPSRKLVPTLYQNTNNNKDLFPFLINQNTNSSKDKLLIKQIQMENINKKKHNQLNATNKQNPSNTRSGHSHLNTNGCYDTLKCITTGNTPNSGEQSIATNSCSTSYASSYTSASGSTVSSPTTSLYTKSSEKGKTFEDEELSNDYTVHVQIIEDINDKENINMNRRSSSASFINKKKIRTNILNKNRMTMTDIDSIYNESSKSNDTVVIHDDESCLSNVLDEYLEESEENNNYKKVQNVKIENSYAE